jgi:hypothetical protein
MCHVAGLPRPNTHRRTSVTGVKELANIVFDVGIGRNGIPRARIAKTRVAKVWDPAETLLADVMAEGASGSVAS